MTRQDTIKALAFSLLSLLLLKADLRAVPEGLSSVELNNIYALYEEKYVDQSRATDVYYWLIGARRGSQLYVLYLSRRDG